MSNTVIEVFYEHRIRPSGFRPNVVHRLQSKKISNDEELIQSDPTSCLKTKREITKYIN